MKVRMFTIGYGSRTPEELVKSLSDAGVTVLVDVRFIPYCKWNPSFSQKGLKELMANNKIEYIHDKRLGNRSRELTSYTMSQGTMTAIDELYKLAKNAGVKVALLCSERDAQRCHRRALTNWLVRERGVEVIDL